MRKIMVYALLALFFSCPGAETVGEVNGKKISSAYLQNELKKLPDAARKNYENDHPGFLEELITKELLLQEAKVLKIDTISMVKSRINADKTKRDDIMIEELFKREVLLRILVSEEEMKKFYDDNKSQMQGMTYDQMKSQIQSYLTGQKQMEMADKYIADLRAKAKIKRSDKWLKAEESKLRNPIDEAFKNKLPTMVDFGAGTCLPCIQMKPIIEELQHELATKANILLIDVNENPVLTRKYKIMLIPTQIFFDATGTEIHRHTGFYPKDSILVNLKKAGLN